MTVNHSFSNEELACFSELFAIDDDSKSTSIPMILADIPKGISAVFAQASLTLLAEIGPYKLWFPLQLDADELGQFKPRLGVPEVIDVQGIERSWRLTQAGELVAYSERNFMPLEVLSLSSTGLAVRTLHASDSYDVCHSRFIHLLLPSGSRLDLPVESVRTDIGGVNVLKIRSEGDHAQLLRQYLFNCHRKQYSHLYSEGAR
ncbi:hypothetical protein FJQ87_12520 [Shewanella sp. SNU WT4]|uniref:hypothetical protein n=1 Tax=Shewanella sp. SNU WT4 TaxID=2590015 RepID=UPI0011284564|nr:hypothetical protein [Shewanella sp. SNU WT4]QDF67402.1 hypothetical protein FJQ87_12520 [Shewanella sp. SNU WT4]